MSALKRAIGMGETPGVGLLFPPANAGSHHVAR